MKSISIISFFLFQSYLFSQVFEGITLLTNLGGAENIELGKGYWVRTNSSGSNSLVRH